VCIFVRLVRQGAVIKIHTVKQDNPRPVPLDLTLTLGLIDFNQHYVYSTCDTSEARTCSCKGVQVVSFTHPSRPLRPLLRKRRVRKRRGLEGLEGWVKDATPPLGP
jgi:hypothetical protein